MLEKPTVLSICIPTYNRPECMRDCLSHYHKIISGNGLAGKVEICISDNSESGSTGRAVRRFSKKLRLKYSRNKKNLGYDRNVILALSMASGEFLQLAGDELFYSEKSLVQAVRLLESGGFGAAMFDDDGLFPARSSVPKASLSGGELLNKALSLRWVRNRNITHIDYVIIRNSHFREYLGFLGKGIGKLYGLTFIQLSFYFFAFRRAGSVAILGKVNDSSGQNVPRRVGVYFPADDARVFYNKYFFEIKACKDGGILDASEYGAFKRSFLLSAPNHLLRIRTHMYPRIYGREIGGVLSQIVPVEKEYSGAEGLFLCILRKCLFVRLIPYHLLYEAFVLFRSKVLKKPRVSALELYDSCLDGKKINRSGLYKTDF